MPPHCPRRRRVRRESQRPAALSFPQPCHRGKSQVCSIPTLRPAPAEPAPSASFWRGGTSRGILFRAKVLAYSQPVRDRIILSALGSPDKGGRQIDGLGGGVSSLSKACIVGTPGEGLEDQLRVGRLPGASWADEDPSDIDCVYRFAQVGVREASLDWTATCGNMAGAVALACLSDSIVPYSTLFTRARELPKPPLGFPLLFPLKILSASNGKIMRARVPIDPFTLQAWEPAEGEGCQIAGVPGEAAGIEIEMPLELDEGDGGGGWLVTGRAKDIVEVDGVQVRPLPSPLPPPKNSPHPPQYPISLLSSGLPNIVLPTSSLPFPLPPTLPASALTSHPLLPSLLERIRTTAAQKFRLPLSLASPKISLVGPVPQEGYATSSGGRVEWGEADLVVRAVSSGDFHATVPGTTLGAVNLGVGRRGTVIHDVVFGLESGREGSVDGGRGTKEEEVVTVRAAHAAGVSTASVRFEGVGDARRPTSVVMLRTAREIMRGSVACPERIFWE